jgi:Flp pilus assembly protein TadD
MGILAALEGRAEQAELYLKQSVDLLPEWPASYSALGVLYYQTGQMDKARQVLQEFRQSSERGALDVQRIEQVLASAPENSGAKVAHDLSPLEQEQFLQFALSLADQTL